MATATSKRRDPAVTSRMMAAVRSKDSRAEMLLRQALYARGVRYRLHARDVLGKPDIVFRTRRVAVFVDGDFWHGNAHRLRGLDSIEELFPTNREWWTKKLSRTMERDREVNATLEADGWSVLRLWESDILRDPVLAADRVQLLVQTR